MGQFKYIPKIMAGREREARAQKEKECLLTGEQGWVAYLVPSLSIMKMYQIDKYKAHTWGLFVGVLLLCPEYLIIDH